LYNTPGCIDPVATEKRNLEIVKVNVTFPPLKKDG
jgi:hypothetical protein